MTSSTTPSEPFLVDILSGGASAELIEEGSAIDIVVSCNVARAEDVRLFVGETLALALPALQRGERVAVTYDVGTDIGAAEATVRDAAGRLLAPGRRFFVSSRAMPLAEVERVRTSRIPTLAKRVDLDDAALGEAVPTSRRTIGRLESTPSSEKQFEEEIDPGLLVEYSRKLLDLSQRHLRRLAYGATLDRRLRKGSIRGRINWERTAVAQAQRGVEGPLYHVCERRRRTFSTPLNQLLVDFHGDLVRNGAYVYDRLVREEEERAYWNRRLGRPHLADARTREVLASLRGVMGKHHQTMGLPVFNEVRDELAKRRPEWRRAVPQLRVEASRQKNRSYRDLVELWVDYDTNFRRRRTEQRTLEGASMEEVFKLWLAIELAHAFELMPALGAGRFVYASEDRRLRLAFEAVAPAPRTWLDDLLTQRPADGAAAPAPATSPAAAKHVVRSGPDVAFDYDGRKLVIDAVYSVPDRESERARLEALLGKVAARRADVGALVYPGERLRVRIDTAQGRRPVILAIVPLRAPPAGFGADETGVGALPEVSDYLRAVVRELALVSKVLARFAAIEAPRRLVWKRLRLRLRRRILELERDWSERFLEPARRAIQAAIGSVAMAPGAGAALGDGGDDGEEGEGEEGDDALA